MKKLVLIVILVIIGVALLAENLNGALSELRSDSDIIDHEGDTVLVGKDFLDSESSAYGYVAWASVLVLYAREGWETYSSANSWVSGIDSIAAAWSTEYQDFVVEIPVSEIRSNFDDSDYRDMDPNELMDEIQDYINYYGDVSPLSMW